MRRVSSAAETPPSNSPAPPRLNTLVFGASAGIVVVFTVLTLLWPSQAEQGIGDAVGWISEWFGWWYFLIATVMVAFVIAIAASRFGTYRLGPEESRPEYSMFTWTAMLFAAGIGVDLMFYSVAEPVSQYLSPPTGAGRTDGAAKEAVTWTLFHYGITGWAMYAVMGMALAYFAFRRNLPLAIRSALYPVFGKRVHGRLGDTVDVAAVIGTIFGVATSLGIGIVQLNYGLKVLFDIPEGKGAQVGLVVLSVVMGTISATTGVDKGIRRLSELNVLLSLFILLFVLVNGHAGFLLNGLVMNAGDYVSSFAGKTMDTMAWAAPTDWLNTWTLFFWAWWIAWAPFVGLFLARISRGRTIRQFVFGVLTIPFCFILLWVSIFGNSALDKAKHDQKFAQATFDTPQAGFYSLLESYPWATFLVGLATLTGLLYYVTSADSGALVMGNFTSRLAHPMQDCAKWLRVFWSLAIGALTLSMMFAGASGSITTLTNATIIMGLPFSFVLAMVLVGLYRSLREESIKRASVRHALPSVVASHRADGLDWRSRVRRTVSFPDERGTRRFLDGTAEPALRAVAEELDQAGLRSTVERTPCDGGLEDVRLRAHLGTDEDFVYSVRPRPCPTPGFAVLGQRPQDLYYRCEVHLAEGSQGYTVNGFGREQLIGDVMDQYERHLSYLHLLRSETAPPAEAATPETTGD